MNYLKTLQDQVESMARGFVQTLPSLVIALLVLVVTWFIARFAARIADRLTAHTRMRADLKNLVHTLIRLAIWLVGFMIAMTVAIPSLTPASLFAGLGVGALAIGFAFQDIFENFLAGVLIMLREKMQIGDSIECEGIKGKVEKITLRETHVRQFSGEVTVVPNSMLFKNPVQIMTDMPVRRSELVVGISYDADLEEAEALIRGAVESVEHVDNSKPVLVFAQNFGASSIDFQVLWWANGDLNDLRGTKSEVLRAIKRALDGAGIELPYPYVTNTFKEPVEVDIPKRKTA